MHLRYALALPATLSACPQVDLNTPAGEIVLKQVLRKSAVSLYCARPCFVHQVAHVLVQQISDTLLEKKKDIRSYYQIGTDLHAHDEMTSYIPARPDDDTARPPTVADLRDNRQTPNTAPPGWNPPPANQPTIESRQGSGGRASLGGGVARAPEIADSPRNAQSERTAPPGGNASTTDRPYTYSPSVPLPHLQHLSAGKVFLDEKEIIAIKVRDFASW